ncbi:MAG: glucuronate isomerase [Phycisphaerae bacterium]|jgi:glucuronate isomerase|nr:glucuronate isomerase [Phycisphaerae bacterium]
MSALEKRLLGEIKKIRIIDCHSHVNAATPSSANLRELLGYHYFTELACSAGMDKRFLAPDVLDDRMLSEIVQHMARFENTVQYSWFIDLARTMFGFKGRRLTLKNLPSLKAACEKRLGRKDWHKKVMRKANIERAFLTNSFDEDLSVVDPSLFIPCLRIDDLVHTLGDADVRKRLAKKTGVEVGTTRSLRKALAAVFDYFLAHNIAAVAASLPPQFTCSVVPEGVARRALSAVLSGKASAKDSAAVSTYVFYLVAELCREHRLPFMLMIGVVRSAYHHGVHQGCDLESMAWSMHQYIDLFNRFPEVTFPVSALTMPQGHELLSFAWIVSNVVVSGHWWYTNVPSFIETELRGRLEALPKTKLLGYYSDMHKVEFGLPKFNMYRRVLAKVLAGSCVETGRMSEAEAVQTARMLLRGNVETIFKV